MIDSWVNKSAKECDEAKGDFNNDSCRFYFRMKAQIFLLSGK